MNNGLKLGLSWTELLSMPLHVLNRQIAAANDEAAMLSERAKSDGGGTVRDATQEDIKHFI